MTILRWSALLLGLVLLSCAPRESGVTLDTGTVSPVYLAQRVAERAARVRTLSGSGSLMVDAPEFSGTARFSLALRRADSALIRLEGPFGLDLATVLVTRRGFVAYNSMNNTVTTGTIDGTGLEAVFPVRIPLDRLLDAFSGTMTLPDVPPAQYSVEADCFLLRYDILRGTSTYRVDPEALLVTGFTLADSSGATLLEMRCSRLSDYEGFTLPRRIDLRMPPKESEFVISFSSQRPNDPAPSFAYSIPRNARRVER